MSRTGIIVFILLLTRAVAAALPPATCRPHVYSVSSCDMATGLYPDNGYFLEGPGLETLSFKSAFPPKAGATLQAAATCGTATLPAITVVGCQPMKGVNANGAVTCQIDLPAGTSICMMKAAPTIGSTETVIAVPGYWDGTGTWHKDTNAITFACDDPEPHAPSGSVDSAVGTCVHGGYSFVSSPNKLLACVRAIRADYCGDGQPHTMNGTPIGLHDDSINKMTPDKCDDGFDYEATWSPAGAVCLYHDRWTGVGMSDRFCTLQACDPKNPRGIVSTRSKCNICPNDKVDHPVCAPDRDPVCANPPSVKTQGH